MNDYFTKTCAICGKEIVVNNADSWAYKINPGKGGTIFFCRYSHKRQYEKEHAEKKVDLIAQAVEEETKKPKKMPTERGCIARSLQDVIRAGKNPIGFLREQGYKNPYEAYNAVRHYCETNEPHLAEVLKPLRELPFERTKPTGRPRKSEVETVDKVPPVLQAPVSCIKHVTPVEIQEAAMVPLTLSGGVDYQLKVDEAMKAEVEPDLQPVQCIAYVTAAEIEEAIKDAQQRHDNLKVPGAPEVEEQNRKIVLKPENIQDTGEIDLKQLFRLYSRENILLLVDKAALDCQKDHRLITMSSSGVKDAMFKNATVAAENVGIMKLRKQIRKMLGADEEEWTYGSAQW